MKWLQNSRGKEEYIVSSYVTCLLSHVWIFVTSWTAACQGSLSMGFSRQKFWSVLPFPSPGDLCDPEIEPSSLSSPALADEFFTTSATWETHLSIQSYPNSDSKEKLTVGWSKLIFSMMMKSGCWAINSPVWEYLVPPLSFEEKLFSFVPGKKGLTGTGSSSASS